MTLIDNGPGSTHCSHLLQATGDLAIVLQQPIKGDGPVTLTKDLLNYMAPFNTRVNGVYVIHPAHTEVGKAPTVKELRKGWERVKTHISVFGPNVKRVLLMGDTSALRVAVPVLNMKQEHGTRPDIQDSHGTVFTLPEFELVPTWQLCDYDLKHMKQWMERDRLRFEKLTKPDKPLPYLTYIPNTFAGQTVVVDLETSGLDASTDHITSFGVQWSDTERAIVRDSAVFDFVKSTITGAANIVFHNGAFDLGFLGESFRQSTYGRVRDTLIRARARGELVGGLKHLGNVHTARPGNYAWVSDEAHSFDDPEYICEDLDVTWRLYKLWEKTTPVIELMERATTMVSCQTAKGTAVDKAKLETLAEDGAFQVVQLRGQLTEKYGVEPGQTDALTSRLRELGYPLSRQTKTGKDALTAEVLEEHGLIDILEYRKALKLDSAFVGKILAMLRPDGTLPHHQSLLGARTGRTTMKDFNHQQLPKKGPGKKLIVSRWAGGKIWNCDLKSAEVFTSCYITLDPKLALALQGPDMHRANAARGFQIDAADVSDDQRFQAKSLIFRSIFGGGPQNPTQERVHKYMISEFKMLFQWIERQKKQGQNELRVVDVLGKVTNMLDKFDYAGKWACGRLGINAPVQGTSSHIAIAITLRVWELFRECKLQSLVLFGVHDSFVCDIHPAEQQSALAAILRAFQDVGTWLAAFLPMIKELPLLGELQSGDSWADTKESPVTICSTEYATEAPF